MNPQNPVTGKPFKRLFRAVYWCGVLRIAAALGAINHWEDPLAGLVAFIFMSALTDVTVLRPLFKKTFVHTGVTSPFTETHVTWLKEKQDISPKDLMVFFSKILTIRSLSFSLALLSIPLLWMVMGQAVALVAASFVYVAAMFIMIIRLTRSAAVLPKSYRCVPNSNHAGSFHSINASPTPYSLEWNIRYRGICRSGI